MGETNDDRAALIKSVKTPLGFFVLVVLVIEAGIWTTLGLGNIPEHIESIAAIGSLSIIILLILVVAGIAIYKPEVLSGKHYIIDNLGRALGVDIFFVFHRYISNLEDPEEQEEAFQSLIRKMESKSDVANRRVRQKIVEVLKEEFETKW